MSDLLSALDDALAGLGASSERPFPGFGDAFPGEFPGTSGKQVADTEQFSRISRVSRSEIGSSENSDMIEPRNDLAPRAGAHARSCVEMPGNPGNPGNVGESPAETESCDFPVSLSFPGKNEENREIEPVQASSHGSTLPILPDDVRAGVARELRALAEDGRTGPGALQDAVAITRAKIRNAPALVEQQWNGSLCHVCNGSLNDVRPAIAVLNPGGRALHLHGGECHEAHGRRRAALVDRITRAAGYGAEVEGDAA